MSGRAVTVLIGVVLAAAVGGCASPPAADEAQRQAAVTAQMEAEAQAEVAAAQRDATIARLEEQAAIADKLQADRWRPFRVGSLSLLLGGVPLLLALAAFAWVWTRRGLLLPRKVDGALPFRLATLTVDDSRMALAGRQAADLAVASQQPVPQTLTWSPRSEYRNDVDVAAGELPALTGGSSATSFLGADPLNVFLGTGAQGPHVRPWDDLLTVGFTGDTGQGKTWSCVSLVYQAIAAGHRVIVLDPQGGNADGLAARLAPVAHLIDRIAVEDHEIAAAVASVRRTFAERSKRADGGVISKADLQPVTVAADEVLVMGRELPDVPLGGMLQDLAQGGRKCAMRALALAQRWATASDAIDADFRNTITQWVIHQSPPQDASMATAKRRTTDELRKAGVGSLQPGECLLSLRGSELVRVVQPTPDELSAFANRFPTTSRSLPDHFPITSGSLPGSGFELPPVASGKRSGSDPEVVAEVVAEVVGGAADPVYEEARRLFREGCTAQEVRDVIAGRRVTKGREFDAANARLNAIIQALAVEAGQ